MSTRFCVVRSRPTSRSSSQLSLNWSSTSRPLEPSALQCRPRCSPAPMRSSNEAFLSPEWERHGSCSTPERRRGLRRRTGLEGAGSIIGAQVVSGHPDIRLLLADVDGTLVTRDKVLTEAAKEAVRELYDAGIALAITSGRPPRGMSMLIEPLALRGAIAGFNGGVFVNPDLSVIESHTLDPATAKEALTLILGQGL